MEVYDEEQIEQEDEETVESDKESSQGDDSGEHDRELHEDETTMGEVEGEDEVDLDPIPEVDDAEVERGNGDEEGFVGEDWFILHLELIGKGLFGLTCSIVAIYNHTWQQPVHRLGRESFVKLGTPLAPCRNILVM